MILEKLLTITSSDKGAFSEYERVTIIILNFFSLLSVIMLAVFGSVLFFQKDFVGTVADGIAIAAILSVVLYFRITSNIDFYRASITILTTLYFVYLVSSGGSKNTGLFWCYIYPVLTYYLLGYKKATIANAGMLLVYSVILFSPGETLLFTSYDLLVKIRFLISNMFVIFFSFILEYARFKSFEKKKILIEDLKKALNEVKELRGLLPICANCKQIRNDDGSWVQVEEYISSHSKAQFTHGLCRQCIDVLYGENFLENDKE